MKIITNSYIPFHGYIAMAVFNVIFWRKEYAWYQTTYKFGQIVNHESIHVAQMKDFCPWIPIGGLIFYIVYLFEWLFRLLFTKDFMSKSAYSNLSFEKEAKTNEKNLDYLTDRKHFSQWRK